MGESELVGHTTHCGNTRICTNITSHHNITHHYKHQVNRRHNSLVVRRSKYLFPRDRAWSGCCRATPWWRCRTPPPGRTTTRLSSTRENVFHMLLSPLMGG